MLDRAPVPSASERIRELEQRVAARVREARKAAGMSQETVAAALDLSFQQVQKYENGKNRISPGKLMVLAELFGRDIAWFFSTAEATDV